MDPTGDNAPFLWDESADVETAVGTTTATGDATGNVHLQPWFYCWFQVHLATQQLVAVLEVLVLQLVVQV